MEPATGRRYGCSQALDPMTRPLHIGLLGAMPEEIGSDLKHLQNLIASRYGDLTVSRGQWHPSDGEPVQISLAWSGWGKVSAARATTRLLASAPADAPIDLLLFTGVAGAADAALGQWDVLLADAVVQHDMDARPLCPRFSLPALQRDRLIPQQRWLQWAEAALQRACAQNNLTGFGKLHRGLIGTGDQFIGDADRLHELRSALPGLKAVEMEGAALAQVAEQEGVPWLVLRVISDGADESAAQNFSDFVETYDHSAWQLIEALLSQAAVAPEP